MTPETFNPILPEGKQGGAQEQITTQHGPERLTIQQSKDGGVRGGEELPEQISSLATNISGLGATGYTENHSKLVPISVGTEYPVAEVAELLAREPDRGDVPFSIVSNLNSN
jgi:hypothetical protein